MSSSIVDYTDKRLGAVFSTKESATSLLESLRNLKVNSQQVELIAPQDFRFNEKLEGKSKVIGQKMIAQHMLWASAGLLLGAAIAGLLVAFGPEFTQRNPTFTFIALISPSLFTGLFISGLLSLRPDHDLKNEQVRKSAQNGNWTVLIKLENGIEREELIPVVRANNPKSII